MKRDRPSAVRMRARLLIATASVAMVAVGTFAAAGANAGGEGQAQPSLKLMSMSAPGSPGAAPSLIPPDQLPSGAAITPLASGPGCDDGRACMWRKNGYEGEKQFAYGWMHGLGWLGYDGYKFNSTKNRFGNRAFWVADAFSIISCLDPNENRPNLNPAADRFNVGGGGSHC